jgi:hypothetical protein
VNKEFLALAVIAVAAWWSLSGRTPTTVESGIRYEEEFEGGTPPVFNEATGVFVFHPPLNHDWVLY